MPISATTGHNVSALWDALVNEAQTLLPGEGTVALNARQARLLGAAADALGEVRSEDIVLTAEALRRAAGAFDQLTGRAGVEDMLDALFGRFCLGK